MGYTLTVIADASLKVFVLVLPTKRRIVFIYGYILMPVSRFWETIPFLHVPFAQKARLSTTAEWLPEYPVL